MININGGYSHEDKDRLEKLRKEQEEIFTKFMADKIENYNRIKLK